MRKAIERLEAAGKRRRDIVVYTLFNYTDDPSDFLDRVKDLLSWGVVSYPMRYEPLTSLAKNRFVSPRWDPERLEMVADARRVMGCAGAFPPYRGLVKKVLKAESFDEAFKLRPLAKAEARRISPALREQGEDHMQVVTVQPELPRRNSVE